MIFCLSVLFFFIGMCFLFAWQSEFLYTMDFVRQHSDFVYNDAALVALPIVQLLSYCFYTGVFFVAEKFSAFRQTLVVIGVSFFCFISYKSCGIATLSQYWSVISVSVCQIIPFSVAAVAHSSKHWIELFKRH